MPRARSSASTSRSTSQEQWEPDTYGVEETRGKLGDIVRRASNGTDITITMNGCPVVVMRGLAYDQNYLEGVPV